MQAFRKLLDQLSSLVLIYVRSCLFKLIKLYIDGELNHPGLQRHTEELFPFLATISLVEN